MAEDWLGDVRKYAPDADEAVVKGIERYCGIALRSRDSSLVSFSDPVETGRVRDNFLKRKLALTDPDDALDAAIAAVGDRMKADRTKNRVTVYYLLADHFGRLEQFRVATKGAAVDALRGAGTAAAAAGIGAAGVAVSNVVSSDGASVVEKATPARTSVAPRDQADGGDRAAAAVGATAIAAGSLAGASGTPAAEAAVGGTGGSRASRFADVSDAGSGGRLEWLALLLLALIFVLFFLAARSHVDQSTAYVDDGRGAVPAVATDGGAMTAPAANANATAASDTAAAPPAPAGAGVIAGVRDERPMLTVYFDTGKAAVADGFAAAAGPISDYVATHPGAMLAVSGYNDASGNAAANALLSKNRAKAVQAALIAAGVPNGAVVLEKPADTTAGAADVAEARRVDVTVKP